MRRFRQYRTTETVRKQAAEVADIAVEDLIYPYFVVEGEGREEPIAAMEGISRMSIDRLVADAKAWVGLGGRSVLLFGVVDEREKDARGTAAYTGNPLIARAAKALKQSVTGIEVITDVCLCEYTDHGHCGLLHEGDVENDETLPLLAEMALRHAEAGADMVAPSAMMDGQVEAIRKALDAHGFESVGIMGYSAKYASAFYGPFREAADSAPAFGDRRTYQMDCRVRHQAMEEIEADREEGADYVMVKPAMPYLDIIREAADRYGSERLAAYQVSGEYAMIKMGVERGMWNERRMVEETLTGIRRAGARKIITYYAKAYAAWKKEAE